ncbi:hypothetical protein Lrub_0864 [Legionella rubrilucens]|uniref:Uncharacterized protein n=1 Tax=Legionella rubrilucens TaxID=458 RepID=A0A0W0XUK4_9GAMM|nr:hypothetical protein [Legionella rubrilucens]KTD48513.1 hypothetical protein Lrub_0864 [Legionella rubrilucens]
MKLIIRFTLEGKEDTIESTIQNKEGLGAIARSLIAARLGLDENQCQFTRLVGKESLGYQNAQNDEVFLNYAVVNLGKMEEETESVALQSSESQESRITTGAWADGAPLVSTGSEPGTIESSENPKGLYRSKSTPPFFVDRKRSGSPSPTEEESEEQVSKPQSK